MTTFKQIKSTLELASSLLSDFDNTTLSSKELKQLKTLITKIDSSLELDPEAVNSKKIKKAADALLQKTGICLSERRYEQFIVIHDLLVSSKIKFLDAQQNRDVTWFPLAWRLDRTAALLLSGSGWAVQPLDPHTELSGVWRGYDLLVDLAANYPDLDLDDY